MSNYQDSQEEVCENSQTDLFGQDNMPLLRAPPACNSTSHCDCCAKNTILLKEILKEVKQLQAGKTKLPSFSIQNSAVEKPLHEYLKVRFSRNPFLSDPDTELKSKLLTLRRKYAPDADAQEVLRHGLRFAARKMVDFRSQTKNKILSRSVKSEDVGTLDVDSFVKSIYGKFMQEQSEETSNLAVALRSFCHEKRQLRTQNGEPLEDFWRTFKSYLQDIWTIALRTNGEGSVRGKRKESRDTESKFETRPDQTR
ncbi:uncharacterized protein LOC127703894 [Mytilus californianus]|uniref:uncharacterized protein LOC127703894 n=1 Tax=Mytilus californianus TaxID=6549 RepID=UPI002248205A|nr:uncharacterized protein LOC127703894 [Mytilus californianus]